MTKFRAGLRGCGPNAVLCKTCSVLCVLEQLSVYIYNSSAGPLFVGSNWLTASSDEVIKKIYIQHYVIYIHSRYLYIQYHVICIQYHAICVQYHVICVQNHVIYIQYHVIYIQYHVIYIQYQFFFRQVGDFLRFPPPIKLTATI